MHRDRSAQTRWAGAAVIATVVTLSACGTGGGASAAPSSTMISGPYVSSSFVVPFSVSLDFAATSEGWEVVERPMLAILSPAPADGYDVVVLPRSGTRLAPDGESELPADLVAALDGLDGVEAEQMVAFDRGGPATFTVGAHEVPHVEVRFGAGERGTALFRTGRGDVIQRPAEGSLWRLFDLDLPGDEDVVVIYRGGTDPGRWFGAVTAMLASLEFDAPTGFTRSCGASCVSPTSRGT